ncbi:helix-turn-helix transcriptional regulator [Rhodobacteraceae bacterium]|nr:helix-turn-helix transcriptional regulator [Paracoccaceae bacterium]
MMNLLEYLSVNEITHTKFAKLLGVDRSVVSRIAARKNLPSLGLAFRIEDATEKKVTARSFVQIGLSSSDELERGKASPQGNPLSEVEQ